MQICATKVVINTDTIKFVTRKSPNLMKYWGAVSLFYQRHGTIYVKKRFTAAALNIKGERSTY